MEFFIADLAQRLGVSPEPSEDAILAAIRAPAANEQRAFAELGPKPERTLAGDADNLMRGANRDLRVIGSL